MFGIKKVTGIVLAAGSGKRFNNNINKVYVDLSGKPVLKYSIDSFLSNNYIDELIVVIKSHEENCFASLGYNDSKVKLVFGGNTRRQSVLNALLQAIR